MFKGIRSIDFPSSEGPSSEDNIYPFLRALFAQCPKVESVKFGLRCYRLPEDLPEQISITTHHSVLPRRTFTDLNEDTIGLVSEFLDNEDLFPFAMTCSSLRDWILPIYLHRRGYDASIGAVNLITSFPETLNLISALTLCRSVTTLYRLSFTVPHGPMDMKLFVLFEYLHRFLRLLRKLSKIGATLFDFGGPAVTFGHGVMGQRSKARWRALTFSILCIMAEKSDYIAIYGFGLFGDLTNTYATAHASLEEEISTLPVPNSLQFVQLDATSLKLQVVQEWIKLKLRSSTTIRHLALFWLSPVETWFLPVIVETFSTITWLTMHDLRGAPLSESILKLLCQLPLLATLEIGPRFEAFHYPSAIEGPLPVPPLSHLHSLTCAPTFLEFITNANAGPQLERINILLMDVTYNRVSIGHPLGSARITSKSLKSLRQRATFSRLHIQLTLMYETLGSTLLLEDLSDPAWVTVTEETAELSLCEGREGLLNTYDTDDIRLTLARLNGWLKEFSKLQKLVLLDAGDLKDEMNTIIRKWDLSSICPTLKEVHVAHVAEPLYNGLLRRTSRLTT